MVLDPQVSSLSIEEGGLLCNHNVILPQAFIQHLGMPDSLVMQTSSTSCYSLTEGDWLKTDIWLLTATVFDSDWTLVWVVVDEVPFGCRGHTGEIYAAGFVFAAWNTLSLSYACR